MQPPETRRAFLSSLAAGAGLITAACTRPEETTNTATNAPADVTLRIAPVLVDIAKDHTISTIGYNGQVPGPLIRLKEGAPVTIWHHTGSALPAERS